MRLKELHLELNHFCNLSCVICEHPLSFSAMLSEADIKKILSSEKLMEAETISLTGGEPTLSPIFLSAARAFSAAGKRLVILSNLYDISMLDLFLKESESPKNPPVHIGSSVDGTRAVHDSIRGKKGAYDTLLKNLSFLKKNRRVSLSLTFTVSRLNLTEFWKVFEFFYIKENIPVFPQYFIPLVPKSDEIMLDDKDRQKFSKTLKEIIHAVPEAKFLFYDFIRIPEKAISCGAGLNFMFISPEGNIYVCPQNKKFVLGNIRSGNIDKMLEGRRKALAGLDRKNCASCILKCKN